MDIRLGKIGLNHNQIFNSGSLKDNNIKGFSLHEDGNVYVVAVNDLTEKEKAELIEDLKRLSKEKEKSPAEIRKEELLSKPDLTIQELTELLRLKKVI